MTVNIFSGVTNCLCDLILVCESRPHVLSGDELSAVLLCTGHAQKWLATYRQTSCILAVQSFMCIQKYLHMYIYITKKNYINFNGVFNVSCIVVLTYCICFILVMSNNIIFEHFTFVSVWFWGKNKKEKKKKENKTAHLLILLLILHILIFNQGPMSGAKNYKWTWTIYNM